MKTAIKTTLVLASIALMSIVSNSCLKANDESGVTGSSVISSLSFQYATSEQVSSSYLLQVGTWEETVDGLNIFKHLLDDDYFGLEAIVSGGPIQDLAFQLSKSTNEFKNFLGFDGQFSSQSLQIKLPNNLFTSGIFLASDLSTIDLNQFDYI